MPLQPLLELLDSKRVPYTMLIHSPAYTAQKVAESVHIPGKQLAKTVMVKLDGRLAMAVVPASYRVDLIALAKATGKKKAALAVESEFAGVLPGCELGAMPPFGNLWNIPVYVSDTIAEDDLISFNAGTFREVMTLAAIDFLRLVEPTILQFSKHV